MEMLVGVGNSFAVELYSMATAVDWFDVVKVIAVLLFGAILQCLVSNFIGWPKDQRKLRKAKRNARKAKKSAEDTKATYKRRRGKILVRYLQEKEKRKIAEAKFDALEKDIINLQHQIQALRDIVRDDQVKDKDASRQKRDRAVVNQAP